MKTKEDTIKSVFTGLNGERGCYHFPQLIDLVVLCMEDTENEILEFTEWLVFGDGLDLYEDDSNHKYYEFSTDEEGDEVLINPRTTKELFSYWQLNIKEK